MTNRENSKPQRRRGRPRKSDNAIKAIRTLAAHGLSDAAIRRWFEDHLGHEEVTLPNGERVSPWYETVPDWSTVATYAEGYRPPDPSGWWDAASAPPEQVRAVAPVATAVRTATDGRVRLTNDLAALVERIVAAAPDIPPLAAYILALRLRHARNAEDADIQSLIWDAVSLRAWTPEGEAALDRLIDRLPDAGRLRRWRRIDMGDITVWAHPATVGYAAVPKRAGVSTVITPDFAFTMFEGAKEEGNDGGAAR